MISPLYFITGGCRSGKSVFAQSLAESISKERLYIATAEARDSNMTARIKKHQLCRDASWKTLEIPPKHFSHIFQLENEPVLSHKKLVPQSLWKEKELLHTSKSSGVLLFDCLTLFISGQMEHRLNETNLSIHMEFLLRLLFSFHIPVIIVSNEIGLGGIAATSLGRRFCDIAGLANQYIAERATSVAFIVSGIPMIIKGKFPSLLNEESYNN